MILMGCIARNFFGSATASFPSVWAQWIRMCCLGIVLVRGGLKVSFKGKGPLVLFLSLVPAVLEAIIFAVVGMGVFDMPVEVSFALGFATSSVATVIVTAAMLRFTDMGYGRQKGIGSTLIASCTFDNITSLVCFGICRTIVW